MDGFSRCPDAGRDIGVGADGSAWVIGSDQGIYTDGTGQELGSRVAGTATRDQRGRATVAPWVVNAANEIYRWEWHKVR